MARFSWWQWKKGPQTKPDILQKLAALNWQRLRSQQTREAFALFEGQKRL